MTELSFDPDMSLDEFRRIPSHFPEPDHDSAQRAAARQRDLTKPLGSLGRLEEIVDWLATWQAKPEPSLDRPRVCVFAGNHGVAAKGVSAYPADVTEQMVQNFIAGGAAVNQICGAADAELRVYELSLETPTRDITTDAAMDEEDCARALAYGMMAVEPGIDLICLGEMGIGNTTAAAALGMALFGGPASDWVGPGTGVTGSTLDAKRAAVDTAVDLHREHITDGLSALCRLGGFEMAAICGAVMAARMGRVPVLLDGFVSTVSAAALHGLGDDILDHCRVGQLSPEPGHERLLETLGQKPILDLGIRLGECAGAALAVNVVRAAVRCHNDMATFADAGISGPR